MNNEKFSIGETVILRPYDDLKAVVRAIYRTASETRYECAWFLNDGSRSIEMFLPCELEKNNA